MRRLRNIELDHVHNLHGYFHGVRDFFPQESFGECQVQPIATLGTGFCHGSCISDWKEFPEDSTHHEPHGNNHLTVLLPTGARCIVHRRHPGNIVETHCGWFGSGRDHLSRSEDCTCVDCVELQAATDSRMVTAKDHAKHYAKHGTISTAVIKTLIKAGRPLKTQEIIRLNPTLNRISIPSCIAALTSRGVLKRVAIATYAVATP